MIKAKIAPSLACADFWQLNQEISLMEKGGADFIHADIMDGSFVSNFSLGTDVIKSLKNRLSIPLEVHFQTLHPERYVTEYAKLGVSMFTFHFEACDRLHQMAKLIKESGMKVGVAINPCTPVAVLETALAKIDMVIVMTVDPGFASQQFVEGTLDKVKTLRQMSDSKKLDLDICVDGNINATTIPLSAAAGANVFVLGTSSIFGKQGNLADLTQKFKEISLVAVNKRAVGF